GVGVLAYEGTIGGLTTAERNVISGNQTYGVYIRYNDTPTTIIGNYIGTDMTGIRPVPNAIGIYLEEGSGSSIKSTIGGTAPGSRNLIAGNTSYQIKISHASGVTILGNTIGFTNGFVTAMGIYVYVSWANTIGNITGGGNTIVSQDVGIAVEGPPYTSGTRIAGNSIYYTLIGIDLTDRTDNDGRTANDAGDGDNGPNLHMNYPVLTSAKATASGITVAGTLNSLASQAYKIDFYAGSTSCGAAGTDGKTFLGEIPVSTDASGNVTFTADFGAFPPGTSITATATDPLNDTSEFSSCALVQGPGTFSASAPNTTEGNAATVTVTRTGGTVGSVTVSYATANDSAVTGSDYTATTGTLTFADGEASKTFTVSTIDDTLFENDEQFRVQLSNATGGATIGQQTAFVTIRDNDPMPSLSIAKMSVTEGNSGLTPAVFTAKLSTVSGAPALVTFTTVSGTAQSPVDFLHTTGGITFAPGETEKTIEVLVNGDVTYEPDEEFTVQLTAQSGAQGSAANTCTILNDDAKPELRIDDVSVIEGNSGTKNVLVTVRATAAISGYVNVSTSDGTARAGSDYVAATATLTFANETSKTFTIAIAGDTDVETDETFDVTITATGTGATIADATGVVTIVNDDIGIGPKNQAIAVGKKGTVAISFGQPITADETIAVVSSNPAAMSVPASVHVPAGSRSVTFAVSALDGPATARIEVTLPASLGGGVLSVTASSYPALSLDLRPSPLAMVAGQNANVTATLTPAPQDAQLISLASSNPSVVDIPSSITIPPSGSVTFVVRAITRGGAAIRATLPSQFGSETTSLFVDVADAPVTPVLFSVSPASGSATGGTPVTLSGARLRGDCVVTFAGVPAPTTFASESQLTAITPPGVPGSADVRLSCGADSFNLTNAFTYVAAVPTLSAASPLSGNVAGSTIVKLTGTNLSSVCGVFFGGVAARGVASHGATSLTAVAPPHDAGIVDLSVRCGTSTATLTAAYSYTTAEEPAAIIASVEPLAGSPGQPVTITGLRFRTRDRVSFGGATSIVLSTTNDTHVAIVPELSPGKTEVTIADPNGHVTTTGPIFTILAAVQPSITRATPATAMTGNEIVIDGDGFRAGYEFTIGGRTAAIVSMTYTRAVVRLPALDPGSYPLAIAAGGTVVATGPAIGVASHGVAVTSVSISCASTDGGDAITIYGSGFASGATVTIGNVAATNVAVVDSQTITAKVPASSSAGTAPVVVTNSTGERGSLTGAFRYTSPYDPDGCNTMRRRVGARR
ncbi:MAG TPA: Calx-beta domain-containing protein, partial [Thermoanaerobaculia bacterium]|nr:Calx-beta domain-containing protein [Thermoanaerobaculia bacterium]